MSRWILIISLLFCFNGSFGQVSTVSSMRTGDFLYNVLDKNVGEMFTFSKVTEYLDGSKMDDSKCDNIIYIKIRNEFFKRNYSSAPNIRWFGCNEERSDNQLQINKILSTYSLAYIPAGVFKTSGVIVVPEKAEIYGDGKISIIKLVSKTPTDAFSIFRWATLQGLKLDCSETDMDLSAAILVNPWNDVKSGTGELKIKDVVLVGNYPQLQGVGLKLKIVSEKKYSYQLIAFGRFQNIDIYGFRDGISCELEYQNSNNISYINANIFDNVFIYNCLRPVRIINDAEQNYILSGKSSISSNFYRNFVIQHAVGEFPAFFVDGGFYNDFNAQIIDWHGYFIDMSKKSQYNLYKFLPDNPAKNRIIN